MYGFSLQYCGPPIPTSTGVTNHQSANEHMDKVNSYIATELQHGALLGPFDTNPFSWCHISPMMTRPKSGAEPNDRRVIVDLSFPPAHNVNMAITPNTVDGVKYEHRLPTTDDLVRIIQQDDYKGWLYSVDISRAYRNFPLDPFDWPLTGIARGHHTLIDVAMPFGARCSSLFMQMIANYITRHLHVHGVVSLIYLDDQSK